MTDSGSVERHPWDYRWRSRFPDAVRVSTHEGGAVYACQAEGAWWLIVDEGTLVDLLNPDTEADVIAQLVTVQRFADVASWEHAQAEARR